MGLLQILLILVWAPTVALIAFVLTSWLGHGAQAIWSALTGTRADERSTWPLLLGGVAALAGMVGAVITFPNQAVMQHAFGKLLGYGSTRVEITLRQDDAATRQALLETLGSFMEMGGREIRYRVSTRHGSYTETDEVPSHYRFENGRLEIATGGIVSSDRLSAMQHGFKALAQFPTASSIDAGVPATVSLGKERITVEMLPRTAMLVHRDAAKDWSSVLRTAPPARCHLEVQALFSTDAFRLLMFAGRASGDVEIHTGPDTALRDTQYQLVGMGLVPGSNGRSVKELETDATRIYGVLRLLPPGLNPDVMDCDTALGRMSDPALVAAAMLSTFPGLEGRVSGIEITPSASFSPWHNRGWTAVPPGTRSQGGTRAEAGTRACTLEQNRHTRTLVSMVEEHCTEREPQNAGAACPQLRERLNWAQAELARCRKQLVR
ncbi:hypothetical protein [Comamonas sp.]|uniref:hypothetical protein n=1 Tax=Comamonas sp. TaxID=34028 RepID=UPI0012CACB42|nr:hypothetical protein [Comamonas sp.]MPS92124.1 hypothetical protein [Comamonas sp.]